MASSSSSNKKLSAIVRNTNIRQFYTEYFGPEWEPGKKFLCPFHAETNPSFIVNEDGSFKCFGCGASGGGTVKFYQLITKCSWNQALDHEFDRWVFHPVPKASIESYITRLESRPEIYEMLQKQRGWDPSILKSLKIGLTAEGDQLTIPIWSDEGVCCCLYTYNVFSTPGYEKFKPIRGVEKGMLTGKLWPIHILEQTQYEKLPYLLLEGPGDVFTAFTQGFPGLTVGSCEWEIKREDIEWMKGKNIVVCFDTDDPGKRGALLRAQEIHARGVVGSLRILTLTFNDKKFNDLTNWFHDEKHIRNDLLRAIEATPFFNPPTPISVRAKQLEEDRIRVEKTELPILPISEIRKGSCYDRRWRSEVVVTSKDQFVYACPLEIRVTCRSPWDSCLKGKSDCPLITVLPQENNETAPSLSFSKTLSFGEADPAVLRFIEKKEDSFEEAVKKFMNMKKTCAVHIERLHVRSVTKAMLSSLTKYKENGASTEHIQLMAYFFGTELRANVPYMITGYTAAHPKDGSMIAVVLDYEPMSTTLERFVVTEELQKSLSAFQVSPEASVYGHLMEYYDHAAKSITGIWGRDLLHMAIDLPFHSPVSFFFNQDYVRRGSLDVLVFGDTRCGKGFVAEDFHRYYEHGEIVRENNSFMGLVGGIMKMPKFQGLSWGVFPTRNKDTVIVDEFHEMHPDDFKRLSTLRSEGLATVNKGGFRQTTSAVCSIIWLANTIEGRSLHLFNYGVQAICSLAPKQEQRSRFDYAFAVRRGEVGTEEINAPRKATIHHRFTKDQCHSLILWIKSRTIEQIQFTQEATLYILQEAQKFGKIYSARVELVQGENVRSKIAKVAASIAGRIFETKGNCEVLFVTKRCAETAVKFLHDIYAMPALGYLDYSRIQNSIENLETKKITAVLSKYADKAGKRASRLAEQFLEKNHIQVKDIAGWIGNPRPDRFTAEDFLNELIEHNCMERIYNHYQKHQGFIKILQEISSCEKPGTA